MIGLKKRFGLVESEIIANSRNSTRFVAIMTRPKMYGFSTKTLIFELTSTELHSPRPNNEC